MTESKDAGKAADAAGARSGEHIPTLQNELLQKLAAIGNREQDSGNDGTGCIEVVPDDGLMLDELDLIGLRLNSHAQLAAQNAALVAQAEEMEKALTKFVARLDEIHADPQYLGVWQLHQIHNGPYTGPQYSGELSELSELRKVLAAYRERTK